MKKVDWKGAEKLLKDGKIGVVPTDTLYGISASVFSHDAVGRIYEAKRRTEDKPLIIIISSLDDLKLFGVDAKRRGLLSKIWPGKVSVVLGCSKEEFSYLHRGKNTLAFRMPDKDELRSLVEGVGPLVSTTVNLEGEEPAQKISDIKDGLVENLDFFIDEGEIKGESSTLIDMTGKEIRILRKGDGFQQLEKKLF